MPRPKSYTHFSFRFILRDNFFYFGTNETQLSSYLVVLWDHEFCKLLLVGQWAGLPSKMERTASKFHVPISWACSDPPATDFSQSMSPAHCISTCHY